MSRASFTVRQGRGATDFVIQSAESFFNPKGYARVYGGAAPDDFGVTGFMKLRCYALEKFAAGVPTQLLSWLRDQGGAYAVNVVNHFDPTDDAPRFPDAGKMRLLFGDTATALLFKLTWGGQA